MNLAALFGIVYLAITAGGATTKDAYIALGIVGVWILIGMVWVALNPATKGQKLLANPNVAA
jgi:hypothetical protein